MIPVAQEEINLSKVVRDAVSRYTDQIITVAADPMNNFQAAYPEFAQLYETPAKGMETGAMEVAFDLYAMRQGISDQVMEFSRGEKFSTDSYSLLGLRDGHSLVVLNGRGKISRILKYESEGTTNYVLCQPITEMKHVGRKVNGLFSAAEEVVGLKEGETLSCMLLLASDTAEIIVNNNGNARNILGPNEFLEGTSNGYMIFDKDRKYFKQFS